ncbi:MAG: hypothetical protein RL701_6200 [Pseudomonadota bacterium]|jgi:hypothetical protein
MTPSEELAQAEWLAPWEPLDSSSAAPHERALARAHQTLPPEHALSAALGTHAARALAIRNDDVPDCLFLLTNPERFCVLNVAQLAKAAANITPVLFDSFADFHEACMLPDHLEFTDADVDDG